MDHDTQSLGSAADTAKQVAAIFVAGGTGATLRVLMSGWLEGALGDRLPNAGVLIVNLIGCLLIGFAAAAIASEHWRAIVLGGALGGFTTYSAFALFTVTLAEEQRFGVLATQIGAHLVGGVACVWAGFLLARALGLAEA